MKYFTLKELTSSTTATKYKIKNSPNKREEENLKSLIENCLDHIRTLWGKPIRVNSGYRSKELNLRIGGSSTSQHTKGEAADITTGGKFTNKLLFNMIVESGIVFDQLIDEKDYSWIHVSYKKNGVNRRQVLHL